MGCGLIVMEMDLEAEEEKKVKHRDTEGAEKKGQKEKRARRAVPYGWGEVVGKRAQHAAPLH